MSAKSATPSTSRKSAISEAEPVYEDHRKRKRNRTSKSCINCRMAKRQCDRQRPACQRCVSLGLTGLCAFEVDDSPACSDPRDENARLRRRIAELERVIRELQRKPHPRWAPSGLGSDSTSAMELKTLPSPSDDSDAEMSGGITLTLPFPVKDPETQTTPELSSASECVPSSSTSSGASTPSESIASQLNKGESPIESLNELTLFHTTTNPASMQTAWCPPSMAPSINSNQTPISSRDGMSVNEAYSLGYTEHFSDRLYEPSEQTEYPGGVNATPRPSVNRALSDPVHLATPKAAQGYPYWATISLGDDGPTP